MKAWRSLPDYLAPNLRLLFIGINPGLISAAAGHYYANPRNSFWRFLHEAGLTPALLRPEQDASMLALGYGLTDIVKRPSQGASDLSSVEFARGRKRLFKIVRRYRPQTVCFNGKTAFEGYFGKGVSADFGLQPVTLENCPVFLLPSTSPANAGVPLELKRRHFRSLRAWIETLEREGWTEAQPRLIIAGHGGRTKMRVAIREAKAKELPAVLSLYAQLDKDEKHIPNPEKARKLFRRIRSYPDYKIYLATVRGEIIGTFALLIMDNLAHQGMPSGIVEDVIVDRKWRHSGIGKAMMRFAMKRCRGRGCYKLVLSSNAKRQGAHRFYEKLGFRKHGYSFWVTL